MYIKPFCENIAAVPAKMIATSPKEPGETSQSGTLEDDDGSTTNLAKRHSLWDDDSPSSWDSFR